MAKVKTVRLKVNSITPDPIPYKIWSPHFQPEEVYLEVSLPAEEVQAEGDKVILTLDGFSVLLQELGLCIYKTNVSYNEREAKLNLKEK